MLSTSASVGNGRPNWLRTNYAVGSNPTRGTPTERNKMITQAFLLTFGIALIAISVLLFAVFFIHKPMDTDASVDDLLDK